MTCLKLRSSLLHPVMLLRDLHTRRACRTVHPSRIYKSLFQVSNQLAFNILTDVTEDPARLVVEFNSTGAPCGSWTRERTRTSPRSRNAPQLPMHFLREQSRCVLAPDKQHLHVSFPSFTHVAVAPNWFVQRSLWLHCCQRTRPTLSWPHKKRLSSPSHDATPFTRPYNSDSSLLIATVD